MRKSTPNKPLKVQRIKAYTYKGVDVYRSWVAIPSRVIVKLELQKGDNLVCKLVSGGILYKKLEK
ncbi:MAG: hypothetical protein HZA84_04100 [Thaumarchaeota archaeon]|nr:hypothetical protein [Nitrososphaerota archaeon]